jgi:hypothetical protein
VITPTAAGNVIDCDSGLLRNCMMATRSAVRRYSTNRAVTQRGVTQGGDRCAESDSDDVDRDHLPTGGSDFR